MKGNFGSAFRRTMKGNVGSKLHPEIDTLVKQWLYRMWTPCSDADDVYRILTQVLQRMWNKRSTVCTRRNWKTKVVCRRISESQKKGLKAQHIETPQTKWIRHGWKNRRRSVSRLPCSSPLSPSFEMPRWGSLWMWWTRSKQKSLRRPGPAQWWRWSGSQQTSGRAREWRACQIPRWSRTDSGGSIPIYFFVGFSIG